MLTGQVKFLSLQTSFFLIKPSLQIHSEKKPSDFTREGNKYFSGTDGIEDIFLLWSQEHVLWRKMTFSAEKEFERGFTALGNICD